jgi:hypothetical protein
MKQLTISFLGSLTVMVKEDNDMDHEDIVNLAESDPDSLPSNGITLVSYEKNGFSSCTTEVPDEECGGGPDSPAAEEAGQG